MQCLDFGLTFNLTFTFADFHFAIIILAAVAAAHDISSGSDNDFRVGFPCGEILWMNALPQTMHRFKVQLAAAKLLPHSLERLAVER